VDSLTLPWDIIQIIAVKPYHPQRLLIPKKGMVTVQCVRALPPRGDDFAEHRGDQNTNQRLQTKKKWPATIYIKNQSHTVMDRLHNQFKRGRGSRWNMKGEWWYTTQDALCRVYQFEYKLPNCKPKEGNNTPTLDPLAISYNLESPSIHFPIILANFFEPLDLDSKK